MKKVVGLRRFVSSLLLLCSVSLFTQAADKSDKPAGKKPSAAPAAATFKEPELMPLADIKVGMKGVARTVFQGTVPEEMGFEVLGVLKNANGPKSDMILVRLVGKKPEFTGVVAGMSGSPAYIDGKLIGALSFRIGVFSKEPIAGITPIAEMLEINELDRTPPPQTSYSLPARGETPDAETQNNPAKTTRSKTSSAVGASVDFQKMAQYMTPIAAPLVFNGFTEETLKMFAPQFA
ncbi:MAG TPA: hypothetical protein VM009_02625, partial [Terriglobales bacterium]|nr:hypothetical protein [Terriglobales bacterium]